MVNFRRANDAKCSITCACQKAYKVALDFSQLFLEKSENWILLLEISNYKNPWTIYIHITVFPLRVDRHVLFLTETHLLRPIFRQFWSKVSGMSRKILYIVQSSITGRYKIPCLSYKLYLHQNLFTLPPPALQPQQLVIRGVVVEVSVVSISVRK
jgi:hypothetical protein